tara:strand:- start:376 stop:1176 length:801 start_codon:yes stop_codon:yes gene_type:complete
MNRDITIIITLYKTPIKVLKNLEQYRNFKVLIFEQEGSLDSKKKLGESLNINFNYYYSKKNIGLSKASNILLKKVKTKYCVFTQADIEISFKSIIALKKHMLINKNIIIVGPNFKKNKIVKNFEFVKKINTACLFIDVKKMKKIGFFDEDFFLYWEDIELIDRINLTNYRILKVNNIFANHYISQSSIKDNKTEFLRAQNLIFGELLYDYKNKKLRFIKIIRKIIKVSSIISVNIFILRLKSSLINLGYLTGIIKFVKFYLRKIFL